MFDLVVWLTVALCFLFGGIFLVQGIKRLLTLAIDLAAKLEPKPGHPDQFWAYQKNVNNIADALGGGLVLLAIAAGTLARLT